MRVRRQAHRVVILLLCRESVSIQNRTISSGTISISRGGFVDTPLPIGSTEVDELNESDKTQGEGDTGPEAPQAPTEAKSSAEADWHGKDVVAKDLDVAPNS